MCAKFHSFIIKGTIIPLVCWTKRKQLVTTELLRATPNNSEQLRVASSLVGPLDPIASVPCKVVIFSRCRVLTRMFQVKQTVQQVLPFTYSSSYLTCMSSKLESAIWSRGNGQRMSCFHRCQLTITWMSDINDVPFKLAAVSAGVGPRYHPSVILVTLAYMKRWTDVTITKTKFSHTDVVPYFLTHGVSRARLRRMELRC